jgi:DNA-binding CsgD family transcriptional regulator
MNSLKIQRLNLDIQNLNACNSDLLLQSLVDTSSISRRNLLEKDAFIDEVICDGEIVRELVVNDLHYYLVKCNPMAESPQKIKLSPREKAIAGAIAEGKSSKEISKSLNISFWTVNTYLKRIFIKLNVTTRPAMVARLMEDRLLENTSVENGSLYFLLVKTITNGN